jgi:hypothetical protein
VSKTCSSSRLCFVVSGTWWVASREDFEPNETVAMPARSLIRRVARTKWMFFLGIWACALAWGGPCQFSGATSLGRDASDPWRLSDGAARYAGNGLLVVGVGLTAFAIRDFAKLQPTGLLGLVLFLAALTVSSGLMALFRPSGSAVLATSGAAAVAIGD